MISTIALITLLSLLWIATAIGYAAARDTATHQHVLIDAHARRIAALQDECDETTLECGAAVGIIADFLAELDDAGYKPGEPRVFKKEVSRVFFKAARMRIAAEVARLHFDGENDNAED